MTEPLASDPSESNEDVAAAPLLRVLRDLHARHTSTSGGELASYIPELALADPNHFGICLAMVDGTVHEVGDTREPFTIQSVSKPLTYALALDALGLDAVAERIGVEPTGDQFNSIQLDGSGQAPNAMVNSGAIVAAHLVRRQYGEEARTRLLDTYSSFAGRELDIDRAVAASERSTGHRNRAIAHLLRASGTIDEDPEPSLDLYFDQCSVQVDCRDLGVIAATLANGGRNPIDGSLAAGRSTVSHTLSVMAMCGMYDGAGRWLVSVGLPAKSGVSGGIIAVLPGQFGIGLYSPPLDEQGNSVRGVATCRDLTTELGLGLMPTGRHDRAPALDVDFDDDVLELGLSDNVDFPAAEMISRRLSRLLWRVERPSWVIIDLTDCDTVHDAFPVLLGPIAERLTLLGGRLAIVGASRHPGFADRLNETTARSVGGTVTVDLAADVEAARRSLDRGE